MVAADKISPPALVGKGLTDLLAGRAEGLAAAGDRCCRIDLHGVSVDIAGERERVVNRTAQFGARIVPLRLLLLLFPSAVHPDAPVKLKNTWLAETPLRTMFDWEIVLELPATLAPVVRPWRQCLWPEALDAILGKGIALVTTPKNYEASHSEKFGNVASVLRGPRAKWNGGY